MSQAPTKRRGRPPAGGREAILVAALELLRERGIARLTTKEIASLAGVSEASIFYHYGDRAGLLKAVFEEGVKPLMALGEAGLAGTDRRQVMLEAATALELFLDQALPVVTAAQSDAELRDALAAYMGEHRLGPHRGVATLAAYLADEQAAGRVRADVDPRAVALMLAGSCMTRAQQRQMPVPKVSLPSLEDVVTALDTMLSSG
jgi:AcrR family transcriptional regulator